MNKLIILGMVFLLFFGCTQEQTGELQNNTGTQGTDNVGFEETAVFVEFGDHVEVEYTGYLDGGIVFDSNVDGDPLGFVVGAGQVIPGFENAVLGMKVGEEKTVRLEPEEAYGIYNTSLIADFPLANVPEGVQIGDKLVASNGAQGVVVNVTDEFATVDFNHQFAGIPLNFIIKVLKIN